MRTIYLQRIIRALIVLSAIALSNHVFSQAAVDSLSTDDASKSPDTFTDQSGSGGKTSVYVEKKSELGIDTTAPGALRDVIDGTSNTFRDLTDGTSKPTSSAQGQIKAGVSTDTQVRIDGKANVAGDAQGTFSRQIHLPANEVTSEAVGEASKEARKEAGKGAKQEARNEAGKGAKQETRKQALNR